jgi:hypothetical protein
VVANPFESQVVPAVVFGSPVPSLLGPAANTDIGIRLNFTLSPGDIASFTSVFVVEPVPEPSTIALIGLGAIALLGLIRRK